MIINAPPQFGQCSMSISNTRLSNLAQLSRTGRWCAQLASHSTGGVVCVGGSGSCGKLLRPAFAAIPGRATWPKF